MEGRRRGEARPVLEAGTARDRPPGIRQAAVPPCRHVPGGPACCRQHYIALGRAASFPADKTQADQDLQVILGGAHGDVLACHVLVFLPADAAELHKAGQQPGKAGIEARRGVFRGGRLFPVPGRSGLDGGRFRRFRSLAVGLPVVGPRGRAGELAAFRSRNVPGKGVRSQLDILCKNEAIFAKSQGPGQAVLQFAHVARPVVFLELAQGAAAEARRGQALGFRGPGQEEDGQQGQVGLAPAQGGRADGDDGQAVIEVLAEGAFLGVLQQFRIGGGDDAGVEGHVLVAAQGTDHAGGKGPQQGLLDLGGSVADLVQHQGAALGREKGAPR